MRSATLVLCVVLVAACSGQGPAATGAQGTGTQATAGPGGGAQATPIPPAAEPGGSGTAVAHVEVASGDLAGTYDATGIKYDCNMRSDVSGATYLDLAKVKGLSGLTFVSGEPGGNVTKFYFQANFADPAAGFLQQPSLEIQTQDGVAPRGKGSARLEDKGGTIKWTVDGTTADGIGLKGTIECGPVDRR